MIGAEIGKALGLDGGNIAKIEMTFTAHEATVVVTMAHLDDFDRPASARLVETLKTFDLIERSAPAHSAAGAVADGVDTLGLA